VKNNGAQLRSFPTSSPYEGAYLHDLAAFALGKKQPCTHSIAGWLETKPGLMDLE
jgi:hypothetical protein